MAIAFWQTYEDVDIYFVGTSGPYSYQTAHVALDADGSPRAYHPEDKGIDANANAGYPNKGWRSVLAVDPVDRTRAYVQTAGAYVGFFVAKTSLRDHTRAETDTRAYVNSEEIPYLVFPGAFYALAGTGRYGDVGMARLVGTAHECAFVVADGGPAKAPLGEMSIALAIALGGRQAPPPNPRTGAGSPKGLIQYMVFPKSATVPAWPRTSADIDVQARTLLDKAGGWPDLPQS